MTAAVRPLLAAAVARLAAAGAESAAQDARILLSFVTGVELVRLPLLTELDDDHDAGSTSWSPAAPSACPYST